LFLSVCVVYWEAFSFGYINYDDPQYAAENAAVLSGLSTDNVSWAFSTAPVKETANWHPVTWLSLMLDAQLFGPTPSVFHRSSILIHAANSALLFLLMNSMTRSPHRSAFVATIFAIHPLHVESVVWISERKDVLSTCCGLIAMVSYFKYTQARGTVSWLWYAACFIMLAISLMAKQMLVTAPVILLLLDYWPLRRFVNSNCTSSFVDYLHRILPVFLSCFPRHTSRLIVEKIPFALLSIAFCTIAILSQSAGNAVVSVEDIPVHTRFATAIVSYGLYLQAAVWPASLAVLYPYPVDGVSVFTVVAYAVLFFSISLITIRRRACMPFLATGWFWFVISLVPVIGIVQIGNQLIADRYMYIPLIGLTMMIAWLIPDELCCTSLSRRSLAVLAFAYLLTLAVLSQSQIALWRDSITLFRHTIKVTDSNHIALDCLADAYASDGEYEMAINAFLESLAIHPDSPSTKVALSRSLAETGDLQPAIRYCISAINQAPTSVDAHILLGQIAARLSDTQRAMWALRRALQLDPTSVEAHGSLGELHGRLGNFDVARDHFEEALREAPENSQTRVNLGFTLRALGHFDLAAEHLRVAIRLEPTDPIAHASLGVVLASSGNRDEAIQHLRTALQLRPEFVEAQAELDAILSDE
jgi:tetratricopeptide (TPR) repeat protein